MENPTVVGVVPSTSAQFSMDSPERVRSWPSLASSLAFESVMSWESAPPMPVALSISREPYFSAACKKGIGVGGGDGWGKKGRRREGMKEDERKGGKREKVYGMKEVGEKKEGEGMG